MVRILENASCPIGGTLEIIAGRWKPEILWHLQNGPIRFNELKRLVGSVSQKMLTQQLRELIRDGLVIRKQYAEIPPRVEYERTELANSLQPVFKALVTWNEENASSVYLARNNYDRENAKSA
ncbi:winged helix-turn-helix transcriptional regulator [Pseudemcibacter aquimaris]|uniref:winged helix-turn-helix transcriptional regulator n=1 Tax=Pseudemcibacter aquimaris TaxID=2857064 RepID=UPI00201342B0|nr:helix-turn-helix domain-containing protein [Pseudemcibacter aquimaris]MCC3860960.1 helix-turn-helix transcriptional regulator [Pseudemcibacter aquimaris]WDU59778.1 helix-turn-helix transcriptional regulator [Pseudemcibacter aquimaris]